MNRLTCILLILLAILPVTARARTFKQMIHDGWKLTFSDEFKGNDLDTTKWTILSSGPIINNELEAYKAPNVVLSGGSLHLIAKHEQGVQDGKTQDYTSGEVTTRAKFSQTYGYFEIRCKVPKGNGYWPAFWLLPEAGEWPPEIDVFEQLGREPATIHLTNHWRDQAGVHQQNGHEATGPVYGDAYHTFAVDWEPNLVIWYVDDVELFRSTVGVPSEPMYMIVNLALGGWGEPPNAQTVFPGSLDVDYVRVYARK